MLELYPPFRFATFRLVSLTLSLAWEKASSSVLYARRDETDFLLARFKLAASEKILEIPDADTARFLLLTMPHSIPIYSSSSCSFWFSVRCLYLNAHRTSWICRFNCETLRTLVKLCDIVVKKIKKKAKDKLVLLQWKTRKNSKFLEQFTSNIVKYDNTL